MARSVLVASVFPVEDKSPLEVSNRVQVAVLVEFKDSAVQEEVLDVENVFEVVAVRLNPL